MIVVVVVINVVVDISVVIRQAYNLINRPK